MYKGTARQLFAIMRSIMSIRRLLMCLALLIFYLILVNQISISRFSSSIHQTFVNLHHSHSQSIDHQLCTTFPCSSHSHFSTIVWTHHGTGIMKYIQWIITRKLVNIKITELDDHCSVTNETYFSSYPTIQTFVQIYIISLSGNFTYQSPCSIKMNQTARTNISYLNHIYFKRKSLAATIVFHQLDLFRQYHKNISITNNPTIHAAIIHAKEIVKHFPSYFTTIPTIKWKSIDSEDLIHSNLSNCERSLIEFLSLLGLNTLSIKLKNIIEYDSHRFIEDAVWWDQSEVGERILNMSIPSRPTTKLTYSQDYYHLNGTRPFIQYLSDNRQCYNDGTFAQMQMETVTSGRATDKPDYCLSKPFDCAFSDMYSFNDREQLYKQPNYNTIKCGFAIPSVFDKVRDRYKHNHTCETIILTSIINCYDPLPNTHGDNLPSFCYVGLLDTQTYDAMKKYQLLGAFKHWDLIDLGNNASLFSSPAKTIETLKTAGQRMFPLAKWIIWLDGKAELMNIIEVLTYAKGSVLSARHTAIDRTSAIEVNYTIERIRDRETSFSEGFKQFVQDIKRQENEYKRDGFYSRSDGLNLRLYDIALFLYRNNHPCNFRYLCGWHNEINYFAYRGQLSVYYSAVRLNITEHLHVLPRKFYHTYGHGRVC